MGNIIIEYASLNECTQQQAFFQHLKVSVFSFNLAPICMYT